MHKMSQKLQNGAIQLNTSSPTESSSKQYPVETPPHPENTVLVHWPTRPQLSVWRTTRLRSCATGRRQPNPCSRGTVRASVLRLGICRHRLALVVLTHLNLVPGWACGCREREQTYVRQCGGEGAKPCPPVQSPIESKILESKEETE